MIHWAILHDCQPCGNRTGEEPTMRLAGKEPWASHLVRKCFTTDAFVSQDQTCKESLQTEPSRMELSSALLSHLLFGRALLQVYSEYIVL